MKLTALSQIFYFSTEWHTMTITTSTIRLSRLARASRYQMQTSTSSSERSVPAKFRKRMKWRSESRLTRPASSLRRWTARSLWELTMMIVCNSSMSRQARRSSSNCRHSKLAASSSCPQLKCSTRTSNLSRWKKRKRKASRVSLKRVLNLRLVKRV